MNKQRQARSTRLQFAVNLLLRKKHLTQRVQSGPCKLQPWCGVRVRVVGIGERANARRELHTHTTAKEGKQKIRLQDPTRAHTHPDHKRIHAGDGPLTGTRQDAQDLNAWNAPRRRGRPEKPTRPKTTSHERTLAGTRAGCSQVSL